MRRVFQCNTCSETCTMSFKAIESCKVETPLSCPWNIPDVKWVEKSVGDKPKVKRPGVDRIPRGIRIRTPIEHVNPEDVCLSNFPRYTEPSLQDTMKQLEDEIENLTEQIGEALDATKLIPPTVANGMNRLASWQLYYGTVLHDRLGVPSIDSLQ